jgi:hypothetical protein
MSKLVTATDTIPAASCYVLTDDSFMSDWGEATGRVNTIILPCADRAEADVVATNARNRDEQRNVRIVDRAPALSSGVIYSLMTREEAPRWYRPGAFEPEPADQPYNGWTNYATWATDLWITNDHEGYDAARAAVARGGPDALRAYVETLPDIRQARAGQGPAPASGLAADLYEDEQRNARETRDRAGIMRDALDKINWSEIAETLGEE